MSFGDDARSEIANIEGAAVGFWSKIKAAVISGLISAVVGGIVGKFFL